MKKSLGLPLLFTHDTTPSHRLYELNPPPVEQTVRVIPRPWAVEVCGLRPSLLVRAGRSDFQEGFLLLPLGDHVGVGREPVGPHPPLPSRPLLLVKAVLLGLLVQVGEVGDEALGHADGELGIKSLGHGGMLSQSVAAKRFVFSVPR